ncbi:DNA polymerase nu [Brachionichthys hirsutus]|uniref:DNA polymerase nu n=1 Tax=Brachionichthys hirsutus TaxID=412623 RepID=UPI003604FD28
MERPRGALSSGPLSPAAQRILAVLRAQAARAGRRDHGDTDRRSQVSSPSSRWQCSQTSQACYQSPEAPTGSLSSQASCWDSSLRDPASQTDAYFQIPQTGPRGNDPAPVFSQPSRSLPLPQQEATETAASAGREDGSIRSTGMDVPVSVPLSTQETCCDAESTRDMGHLLGEEEMELLVESERMTGASAEDGTKEGGHADEALPIGAANEMAGTGLLGANKTGTLNFSPQSIVEKLFDAEGETFCRIDGNDFERTVDVSVIREVRRLPDPEKETTSPGHPGDRPSAISMSLDGEDNEVENGDTKRSRETPQIVLGANTVQNPERTDTQTEESGQGGKDGDDRAAADPRVKDCGKLDAEEKKEILEEAGKAKVLVVTLVHQDGTTQLDPEQKPAPPACGLLMLMKSSFDSGGGAEASLQPNDSLIYLKMERTHQRQELFTRDMLLQLLSRSQLVVCYKAKDLLGAFLQFYSRDLSWRQVAGCRIEDPQVSGWLLDPANPCSCYRDLLFKHRKTFHECSPYLSRRVTSSSQVSQVISGLCSLYWLNMELRSKLQSRGLWELYSNMELAMISVLAVMESHRIHVDKDALKRTSDLLGTKMKQLEREAHRAAGEKFLVTSNVQLRSVLFEKLCLHRQCENKRLPKTVNKRQQSTSEAALLQLQDLHPLPKIILEYRQVHKFKSTFVDGVLSCVMSKDYVSSKWSQTSAVTGRISSKHPNFQALPRQPLPITRKQHIQGKEEEEEVVIVHPRAMFVPPGGRTFLAADFCQVELRLLAHLSSDPELLHIFTNPKADVFTMLASRWKGIAESEVSSEDREHAKRIVYSVVYGAGRERLSGILGVSAEQAGRFQDGFLQTYKEVQAFVQRTIQRCHKQGYVLSIMGRRRTLPNINSPDWRIRTQAERQAVNFVVQGSAADLCKMAMIQIFHLACSSGSLSARLIAQLHDELLYDVEDAQVEEFAALVRNTMESLQHIDGVGVHLNVPLKVAVSIGKSWGSMRELNLPPSPPPPSL